MYFLFLVTQLVNDTEVCLEVRAITLCYKVVDDRSLLLSVSVNTSVSLLQCNETPWNIVVEHDVAEVMKVDTLATTIA